MPQKEDIAALSGRVESVEEASRRHEDQIRRLDEAVAGLRETLARVATRADVDALRRDVTETFAQAARDAQNAIPAKVMAWFTGALVVVAIASLFIDLLRNA